MSALSDRFLQLKNKINNQDFRVNKGLGNEIGYYIFPYPPKEELLVRGFISELQESNQKHTQGFDLIVFDLYDIMIEILKKDNYLEKCFQIESVRGLRALTKIITQYLSITEKTSPVIEYIKERTTGNAVVFISGVGKCYPVIRSHNVLNNLHSVIDKVPVILFYPGEYTGQQLILFSKINDGNYYRAFPIN